MNITHSLHLNYSKNFSHLLIQQKVCRKNKVNFKSIVSS